MSDLPTYEEAIALFKRWKAEPLSSEDAIKLLGAHIEDFSSERFLRAFKRLGAAAASIDDAMERILSSANDFVSQHSHEFPEFIPYQQQWSGHRTRWTELLRISGDLALKTSASYKEYDEVVLEMVGKAQTIEDIAKAADALEKFSQEKPSDMRSDFAHEFLGLNRDIRQSQDSFDDYLRRNGVQVPGEVVSLKHQINEAVSEIMELSKEIQDALSSLEFSPWWNIVGEIVPVSYIAVVVIKRIYRMKDLEKVQTGLGEASKCQNELAHFSSEVYALCSAIEVYGYILNLLPEIWNGFHGEALQLSYSLKKMTNREYPQEFKLRVRYAKQIAASLRKGLEDYAKAIQPPSQALKSVML